MLKTAFVQTIFAEDIRNEVNGQFSIVGVFDETVETESFPLILPRFAMLITLSTHIEDPFIVKRIRVHFKEGATLSSADLPDKVMAEQRESLRRIAAESPDRVWASLQMRTGGENLKIENPSSLLVEMTSVDGNVIQSNKLEFSQKQSARSIHDI